MDKNSFLGKKSLEGREWRGREFSLYFMRIKWTDQLKVLGQKFHLGPPKMVDYGFVW
jgi:hypothetical protein